MSTRVCRATAVCSLPLLLLLCLQGPVLAATAAPVFPDRLAILGLLENREFDELEEVLSTMQTDYEQGRGDERLVLFVLETLANAKPDYEPLINDWVAANPDNYVPYLVRAYYYYAVAASWRGDPGSEGPSATRRQRMRDFLQLAADDIIESIKLKPRLSAADALVIRVMVLLGNTEYREATLQEALTIDPQSYLVRSVYLWSMQPEWGGEPRKMMRFIEDTVRFVDAHPQLRFLLGYADFIFAESLVMQKRFDEAATHFEFAVDKGADHVIYRQRGINFFRQKHYEKALQDFDHALSLWPQDPGTLLWRAQTLQRLDQAQVAMRDLDLARQLVPMQRDVLMAHALLSRKMRRYEQVLDAYEDALFYNRDDADIWFHRGMHYSHELINFEAAATNLKRATELAPAVAAYWYEYAAVLHFNMDCGIVIPLRRYLQLCEAGSPCHAAELEWARNAQDWLQEKQRCSS